VGLSRCTTVPYHIAILLVLILSNALDLKLSASEVDVNYPWRTSYPHLKVIKTKELSKIYQHTTIIDVRSYSEYQTLHINFAINIPFHNNRFDYKLGIAVPRLSSKIIFYSNGFQSPYPHIAANRASKAGYSNVMVYDDGVHRWAKEFPDYATLLGVSPIKPKMLIVANQYKKHLLSYNKFVERSKNRESVVIDLRRNSLKTGTSGDNMELTKLSKVDRKRHLPLSFERLSNLLAKGKFKAKELLIYDSTGAQIQLLAYILRYNKYKNYFFLKGGALEVLGIDKFKWGEK
jgi:rhodanese-related sulfurtransferase